MFENEDKKWEKFRDLTEIMEKTPVIQTPEGFTAKVVARISEEKVTHQSFDFGRLFSTKLDFGFQNSVTKKECAFYFLLTGFFYLIFGLIMIIGLPLPEIMQNNRWLSFQPLFGLLLAVELASIGIVLYKRGDSAIRFVRMGTVLYAALIIMNFWMGAFYIQLAVIVFSIAVFSMTGLVFAFLLGMAIDNYDPENIFSEVSG